ncbi:hypothetical protein [Nostoc sp.]|uniref:hypothetical protein n=1 Tax=Nostoc sp. TaxID=1180 RepID=UPI002FF6D2AD
MNFASVTVSFDTIADFKVANNTLTFSTNFTTQTTIENVIAALAGTPTFSQELSAAATAIGANKFAAFRFGSNIYVLGNNATTGTVGAGEQLIALTGNLVLTNTNFGLFLFFHK